MRGFGPRVAARWHLRLGPAESPSWAPIGFDARDGSLVLAARPSVVWRWSRVWLLG